MNVVGSTWSFDIKRDMLMKIIRFKARLCAQGFTQVKGTDWFRKYSHTIPLDIFRLFLAKMASLGYEITEVDYKTAYLNAFLDIVVYMKQPPGYEAVDENGDILTGPNGEELVCKLIRSTYGLVQSGLMWEEEHHSTLQEEDWEQCPGEACLFKKTIDDQTYYLCTYVDNCCLGFPPGSKERESTVKTLAGYYTSLLILAMSAILLALASFRTPASSRWPRRTSPRLRPSTSSHPPAAPYPPAPPTRSCQPRGLSLIHI